MNPEIKKDINLPKMYFFKRKNYVVDCKPTILCIERFVFNLSFGLIAFNDDSLRLACGISKGQTESTHTYQRSNITRE
jgi:hypothetical protein